MRVLHVDTGREMRGGQWQALYVVRGLSAAGHTPVLMAPPEGPLYRRATQEGFEVHPVSLFVLRRLSRKMDLTHAHDARAHTLAALAGCRRLIVARRVGFPVKRSPASRWKYGRAHRYLAVSEFVKRTLTEAGVPSVRITVVYDGVPLLEPSRASARVVAPSSEDPRKGSALLRQAAARAGIDVHFSQDLAADLGDAGLFVYITEQEGLGSAVLLAMSAQVPVLASRVGGLPEALDEGRSGLLVDNDPEAIAAGMRSLIEDKARAGALAARGRCRVEERFSTEKMVAATTAVYQEMLAC